MSSLSTFLKTYGKVAALLLMMLLGALLPQFHVLSPVIQYLLMSMLFFSFLDIDVRPEAFDKGVLWILAANLGMAFLAYGLFSFFDTNLALAAFMTAIAPTAISSPVIVSFIGGRVEYMLASVLLTNVAMSVVVPVALPYLAGALIEISVWEILRPVLIVMFVPLILARIAMRLPQKVESFVRAGKKYSFPLWLFNLFIISAKASDFLRSEQSEHPASLGVLVAIALVAFALCVANFTLGAWLGGPLYRQEASQALGQKNLSFVIWIALTFVNPLTAMGPAFYVLYHNLYNSWQIYLFEKRRKRDI